MGQRWPASSVRRHDARDETARARLPEHAAKLRLVPRGAAFEEINRQIMEEYLPGLPISHSPPALVVGPGVDGLVPSPLTAEEFDTVTVGGE